MRSTPFDALICSGGPDDRHTPEAAAAPSNRRFGELVLEYLLLRYGLDDLWRLHRLPDRLGEWALAPEGDPAFGLSAFWNVFPDYPVRLIPLAVNPRRREHAVFAKVASYVNGAPLLDAVEKVVAQQKCWRADDIRPIGIVVGLQDAPAVRNSVVLHTLLTINLGAAGVHHLLQLEEGRALAAEALPVFLNGVDSRDRDYRWGRSAKDADLAVDIEDRRRRRPRPPRARGRRGTTAG